LRKLSGMAHFSDRFSKLPLRKFFAATLIAIIRSYPKSYFGSALIHTFQSLVPDSNERTYLALILIAFASLLIAAHARRLRCALITTRPMTW